MGIITGILILRPLRGGGLLILGLHSRNKGLGVNMQGDEAQFNSQGFWCVGVKVSRIADQGLARRQ